MDEVRQIASTHFSNRLQGAQKQQRAPRLVGAANNILKRVTPNTTRTEAFYIYNYNNSAFVIVSGDDRMKPVLGYSDNGAFHTDGMPANLKKWLEQYVLAYEYYNTHGTSTRLAYPMRKAATLPEQVEPLLSGIAWNQNAPFNDKCPENSVTGCVATAMGMIMKYYNYPKIGAGRTSYLTSMHGYSCSYDFEESPIRWSDMLDRYEPGQYSQEQSDAVSELLYACGVAVKMDYDQYSSAASALSVTEGLSQHFKYNDNMQFHIRDSYTSAEWLEMIKTELSEGRPVLYNGASKEVGHEFVLDGYDAEGLVHINWGWGGLSNGYFDMGTLDPMNPGIGGGTTAGGGYTYSQGMITGFQPETDDNTSSHSWYMTAMMLLSETDDNGCLPVDATISIGAITIGNYGMTFNGEIGVALMDYKTGEIIDVLGKQRMSGVQSGKGGNLKFDFTLPENTTDGTYKLCMAAKKYKAEKWSAVRAVVGYTPHYNILVKDGLTQFFDPRVQPKLAGSYKVDGELTVNKYGKFAITVKNTGTEHYFGNVGVLITPDLNSEKAFFCLDEVHLAPGEERTVNVSKALVSDDTYQIEQGTSKICGVYTYGEALFPLTSFSDVTIGYAKPPKITLRQELSVPDFSVGQEIEIPMKVTCEGDYDQYIVAAIFPYGATTTNTTIGQKVDMKDGGEYDITIKGKVTPDLKEGKYMVGIYYYDISTASYSGEIGYATFNVSATTGIGDKTGGDRPLSISQDGGNIHVRCSEAINRVDIVSMAGAVVKSEKGAHAGSNERTIGISDMPDGCYIAVVYTKGGAHKMKFYKKQ